MVSRLAVGVDIGGTRVRVALADESGNFLVQGSDRIDSRDRTAVSKQIIRIVEDLAKKKNVDIEDLVGIGMASTGPMDINKGILIQPSNIPFKEVPLVKPIEETLEIPVFLLNDCTAAALGERKYGAGGKGEVDNIVYVNIGTGIGGGAIVDGNLLLGKDGNAAEIGHFTIDPEKRLKCGCGKRGHWEAYCSGKNIPKFVKMRIGEMDEKEVKKSTLFESVEGNLLKLSSKIFYRCVKKGDKLAVELADEIGDLNSIGFANVIDAYDPSIVTVGGSVALNNREEVLTPVKKRINKRIRNIEPDIKMTPLGEEVGIYGAIAKAFKGDE